MLTELFRKAHVHFIFDTPLPGTVTLDVHEIPLDVALHTIMAALVRPFAYTIQGDVYRVTRAPEHLPFFPNPYEAPKDKPLPVQSYGLNRLILLPHPQIRPGVASSAPLRWGVPAPSGLQLGLWKPAGEQVLLCVLRNAGTKSLRYNDCFLGSLVDLKVWVRPHGTLFWTRSRILWPYEYIRGAGEGVGPTDSNFHDLPPGQEISRQQAGSSGADSSPQYYSSRWHNAFEIPLNAYDWPESKTGVDIKVTQLWTLQDSDSVDSGVISLPLETVPAQSDLPPPPTHTAGSSDTSAY